ncbi:MAG: hypothetical protein JSW52_02300 [Candidatus Coatesbacteria bacterium]|nr:MAG: hypothetical protein JSW52_02300 [Candidatus Coatesbacteria bacterium]
MRNRILLTSVVLALVPVAFAAQPEVSSGPTQLLTPYHDVGDAGRDALIYDQSLTTGIELVSSQDDSTVPFNSRVADDFSVTADTVLSGVEWWGGYYGGTGSFTSVNLEIYNDDDGPDGDPGTGAIWSASVPYADCGETYVGPIGDGEMYKYLVTLSGGDQFSLTAGTTYWLCIQLVMDYPPQAGLAAQEYVNGESVYFVSEYFGFPDWTEGWQVFLDEYDVAFNLYGTSDDTPPTITDTYPKNEDHPCGVPADTWIGFHVQDDASGCDVSATTYDALAGGNPVTWAAENVDETDPLDVTFDLQPDAPFGDGATVNVSIETFDNAGNGPVNEDWMFNVGYTNIEAKSLGYIKAGFTE